MRLTETMLTSSYLSGLNRNLSQIAKLQLQLATNKKVNRPSDNPVAVISGLSVRASLRNIEQYNRNINDAKAWLAQSETALMDMNEAVTSAYELALQAAGGTLAPSEKQSIGGQIRQLRDYMVEIGNSRLGDKYVFGGFNTTTPPFVTENGETLYLGQNLETADAAAISALSSRQIQYEIGAGMTIDIGCTGIEIMGTGDNNLIGVLNGLLSVLDSDGPVQEITPYIDKLRAKQDDVLTQVANIGGRSKRLDLLQARYSEDEFNYMMLQSTIEDIDTAEVITRLKLAETVYEAALSIGSRVVLPNLTDFLR